jgi:hypothetical protein
VVIFGEGPKDDFDAAQDKNITGVTHVHNTLKKDRPYYMHYVLLTNLKPNAIYHYRVVAGSNDAEVSDSFQFRGPYGGASGPNGTTRIALYGDMGVYPWNNMQNLLEDTAGTAEEAKMDLIIHAGDHCYNEGDVDERRADGYMQAFEKTIGNVPWMPIVGNHEFYGTNLGRFLNQTWEGWGPLPMEESESTASGSAPAAHRLQGGTSATTALGAFLSAGNHHGAGTTVDGSTNSIPSHSSRYFSVDFGLVHLVALSLNGYNKVDLCTTDCNEAQLKWLKGDLAAVNRSVTPWVIAMSHYPLYLQQVGADQEAQEADEDPMYTTEMADQAWLMAEECEYEGHARNCTGGPQWANRTKELAAEAQKKAKLHGSSSSPTVPLTLGAARDDLEPIFEEHGVDIYWAGHIHFYETFTGPISKNRVVGKGTHNPKAVIHVCSGNGGPPSPTNCKGPNYCTKPDNCLKCISQPYSYTRLTAYNRTDLLWEQVSNEAGSAVIDSWVVHQDNHGKFPPPGPTPPPTPAPPTPVPSPVPVPGTSALIWAPLTNGKTASHKDLPANAIVIGNQSAGLTYMCRADAAQGGDADLTGSISYAGGKGHCRMSSAGKSYYIYTGFHVLVSTSAGYQATWSPVDKAIATAAALPAHAVKGGSNSGGNTYICRVRSDGGETDIGGSASFAGGPGHCRVAVSNKAESINTGYDLLVAA